MVRSPTLLFAIRRCGRTDTTSRPVSCKVCLLSMCVCVQMNTSKNGHLHTYAHTTECINEDHARDLIKPTYPDAGCDHLASPFLKIGDKPFTMLEYKCPSDFRLFMDRCAVNYSRRMKRDDNITKTVLKSFLKDVSGIGFSICMERGTLTVDVPKWNKSCYRVQPGGVSTKTGSVPYMNTREVTEIPLFYKAFGLSAVDNLLLLGKRKID